MNGLLQTQVDGITIAVVNCELKVLAGAVGILDLPAKLTTLRRFILVLRHIR